MRSLVLLALLLPLPNDARRHGPDSPDRGLPRDANAFAPYHAEPDHLLNRIFRAAWLAELTPAEVAAVLPREQRKGDDFFTPGWVHRKREGTKADLRWFGGDGRQLPIEELDAERAAELGDWLDQLGPKERELLLSPPELAVLFQHDLLRLAARLVDTQSNGELLPKLRRAALAVALTDEELARLRNPLASAPVDETFRVAAALCNGASEAPAAAAGYREVLRRSTRLFDAERTLLWSRVWLAHPDGVDALRAMLPLEGRAAAKDGPEVPLGFRAVLVQGVVAFDTEGRARATPVVVDVRTQVLSNRDPLGADNPSFTRDGIDFAMLQLEREGVRRGEPARCFRRVEADDQELFRDYGTLKHTSYRAQCTLCHRNTDTPEPNLGGFPVLRPHVGAAFAETGEERLRLAEGQAQRFLAALE